MSTKLKDGVNNMLQDLDLQLEDQLVSSLRKKTAGCFPRPPLPPSLPRGIQSLDLSCPPACRVGFSGTPHPLFRVLSCIHMYAVMLLGRGNISAPGPSLDGHHFCWREGSSLGQDSASIGLYLRPFCGVCDGSTSAHSCFGS